MTDPAFYTLVITTSAVLLAYIALWSGLQTFNANPTNRFMRIWGKLALYYAAYTMPFWAVLLIMVWSQGTMLAIMQLPLAMIVVMLLTMGLYAYTVIVQPNRLRLEHHAVDLDLSTPLKVAVGNQRRYSDNHPSSSSNQRLRDASGQQSRILHSAIGNG